MSATASTTPSGMPIVAGMANEIIWDQCTGLGITQDGPQAVYKGNPPPGWEEPATAPTNSIYTVLYKCERVSWGQFERGPIYSLMEWDGNLDNPTSCGGGNVDDRGVLESIWFSDPELVAFAKSTYAMPAYLGSFSLNRTDGPEGREIRWTWAADGNEPSDALIVNPTLEHNFTVKTGSRLFWYNGQGVSRLDFWRHYEEDQIESAVSVGTMQPPMMWATQGPTGRFMATSATHGHESMNATLVRYNDLECKQPV